ncbi:MAG: diaminopimelate decarboxylase [Candidatus Eremiobacteraeota bacterium]|nr:diaminopimelate decarboxylase [Candidatus Eremiobacteraeota bacterium]
MDAHRGTLHAMIDAMHWNGALAPGHERPNGALAIGGIDAQALTERFGTPLLVIDYATLDAAIETFCSAATPLGIEVAYAGKALLLVGLARHLRDAGLHLDVASLGELLTAERAGMPPERITFHGCGKTADELDAILSGRAGRLVADNRDEVSRIIERVPNGAARCEILLRVNTGIDAHTHDFIRTSGDKTKFGFDPRELPTTVRKLVDAGLRFAGLHSHIGSQIYEADAFAANMSRLMEVAHDVSHSGVPVNRVIVGGGFGVQMAPDQEAGIDVATTLTTIAKTAAERAGTLGIATPAIGVEPGRAIIANAGTSLYRVMAVKRQFGRPYVIIDGSLTDNPRPALYGAYHHPVMVRERSSELQETVICGRSCENDRMGAARLPVDIRIGDLLAMSSTGAYTYSMASNYNRFAKPAVVAIENGAVRQLARRETLEEVLRLDCDA